MRVLIQKPLQSFLYFQGLAIHFLVTFFSTLQISYSFSNPVVCFCIFSDISCSFDGQMRVPAIHLITTQKICCFSSNLGNNSHVFTFVSSCLDHVISCICDVLPRVQALLVSVFNLLMDVAFSGLAKPAPVIETFCTDELVSRYVKLDGVVTLVDAKHAMQHLDEVKPRFVVNEAVEQVAYADRIILNKV